MKYIMFKEEKEKTTFKNIVKLMSWKYFFDSFKCKRAYKYTKIKWIIANIVFSRSYILYFRVGMVLLSKSLHPTVHVTIKRLQWQRAVAQIAKMV